MGALAARLAEDRNEAAKAQRELTLSTQHALRLTSAYGDMESGQRGFIMGGSDVFLEPYRRGEADVDVLQAALAQDASGFDSATRAALSSAVSAGDAWRTQAARELALRRSSGRAKAEAEVATLLGKRRFDALRASLDRLSGHLVEAQRVSDSYREDRARQLMALLLAIPATVVFFTGGERERDGRHLPYT